MKKQLIIPIIGAMLLFFNSSKLLAQNDFYDLGNIPEIKISFEKENWRYLLDSLRYNGDGLLEGTIAISGQQMEGAGVRYRSGKAFTPGNKRNGLTIHLGFKKPGQKFMGYSMLDLSSAIRDPSLLREVLAYEIAGSYIPTPKANFVKVFINDDYYGLFVNIEPLEGPFLTRHFGSDKGDLFLSDPEYVQTEPEGCKSKIYGSLLEDNGIPCLQNHFKGSEGSNWSHLLQLTKVLNNNIEDIEKILDVDKALWMLAFNNVIVNLNSYSGQFSPNYYLYMGNDGRFVPIVTNLNLAFGSFKNIGDEGSDLGIRQLIQLDPLLHANNPRMPLLSKLLSNELYQKQYLSHMFTILTDHFKDQHFSEKAAALQQQILSPLMEDVNKYYPTSDFLKSKEEIIGKKSRIPGVVDFMEKRAEFLKMNPTFTILPPAITEVQVKRRERFSSKRVSDFDIQARVEKYAKRVHVYYRFNASESFKEMLMQDDGASSDEQANDGIYGAKITPAAGQNTIEYYIFAENAKAVSYSPMHYTQERHSASLIELNK
ncbi:MAG: CotH kinase family protein [Saprospiraceae bacterium]